MLVREYESGDARPLMELFHQTVHTVCAGDYTPEQLSAWSPEPGLHVETWAARFARKKPFVAVTGGKPVGFVEIDPDGHIDCLYVRSDFQRRRVGTRLLERVLAEAAGKSIARLYAEVSITAVPFFKSHQFYVVREQQVERSGQRLTNFVMERLLVGGAG